MKDLEAGDAVRIVANYPGGENLAISINGWVK